MQNEIVFFREADTFILHYRKNGLPEFRQPNFSSFFPGNNQTNDKSQNGGAHPAKAQRV